MLAEQPNNEIEKPNFNTGNVEYLSDSTYNKGSKKRIEIPTIAEYRQLMNDNESTDQQIAKRLEFLENLCRTIITLELKNVINKRATL